jgi:aerobic carbon-monoxide dehydrogenase medium subunit
VKPAPFGYHRAGSVQGAVGLLSAYEGSARVIAGGQSLVPMLNMRLLRPDALIDINGIASLRDVSITPEAVTLGALVRYSEIERSAQIKQRLPLLSLMVTHIGDRQVRNRGTIGGSLVHGDPTGEMPLACLTLGAFVRVAGGAETPTVREIALEDLYETSYASTLDPCEVLTEVVFPASPARAAFAESTRRHNDFAVASVAAVGDVGSDGRWRHVRIGLGGVADCPLLATSAMQAVEGTTLDDAVIAEAARAAAGMTDPPTDIRGTAEYRRHLTSVYVQRVLRQLRDESAVS